MNATLRQSVMFTVKMGTHQDAPCHMASPEHFGKFADRCS